MDLGELVPGFDMLFKYTLVHDMIVSIWFEKKPRQMRNTKVIVEMLAALQISTRMKQELEDAIIIKVSKS